MGGAILRGDSGAAALLAVPVMRLRPASVPPSARENHRGSLLHECPRRRPSQEFLVLGSQPLTDLRDRIVCATDSVARIYLPDKVRRQLR